MKNREVNFLYGIMLLTIGLLYYKMKKQPRRDYIFSYAFNAITNVILDKIMVEKKLISYPTRFFPKIFQIHVLYDLLLYPTATVLYNRLTQGNKLLTALYKLLYFTVPLTVFEIWAERNTNLIKWGMDWKWYHTFLSVTVKSLITRFLVVLMKNKEKSEHD